MLRLRLEILEHTSSVEFEGSQESDFLLGGLSACEAGLSSVQAVDIGLMMLSVVKSHDLSADVGLESIVAVRESWE